MPKPARAPLPRLSVDEVMRTLEAAGTEQTRKTYRRHGVTGPIFGVLFSAIKPLVKRIGVDHALALALWDTGNHDARTVAAKIADPYALGPDDLTRLAESLNGRSCEHLVAQLAVDGPHGRAAAEAWLASADPGLRTIGWSVVGGLALRDAALPDSWFEAHLRATEATIHSAANVQRWAMNHALIAIGCRSEGLRATALAAAARIGTVDIDHGDTWCKTASAAASIEKAWAYAVGRGFANPAVQERGRESARLRC